MDNSLELTNITYTYPGHTLAVLDKANLTLHKGEVLGLLGDNGSGKSTLLHIAAGLVKPASGTVCLAGIPCHNEKDFAKARMHLGYMLQQAGDQLFCSSILEDIAFGVYNQGKTTKEAETLARAMLAELFLEHLGGLSGSRLSGGEKKMAALATVLVMQPDLLFLDEPTNDLDSKSRTHLIAILQHHALPAVIISHDADFLAAVCTRYCLLEKGQITELAAAPHTHTHIHPTSTAPHKH